jgi:hypothetical protein
MALGVGALVAVPATALLLRRLSGDEEWADFHGRTYVLAWAIVAVVEIIGVISLTGESLSLFAVGFWSTLGAVIFGAIWWGTTHAKRRER